MELDTLAEELKVAGLDEDEAELYLRLLQTGPATVGDLSHFFEVSRSTLYRMLDQLAEQGFVSKSLDQPTVYEPVEPARFFEMARDEIARSRERLDAVEGERLDRLEALYETGGQAPAEHHWVRMEDTERIYRKLHKMTKNADESIWVASNHEVTLSKFIPDVEEAWRICYRRADEDGIDVRLLFDLQEEPYEHVPEWVGDAKSFRIRRFEEPDTIHFVLVDQSDLLMWIRPTPVTTLGQHNDVAVRTNAPGRLASHRMLFERLWPEGDPVDPAKADR